MLIHSVTGTPPRPFSSSEGRHLGPFLFLLGTVDLWWTPNSFPHTSAHVSNASIVLQGSTRFRSLTSANPKTLPLPPPMAIKHDVM